MKSMRVALLSGMGALVACVNGNPRQQNIDNLAERTLEALAAGDVSLALETFCPVPTSPGYDPSDDTLLLSQGLTIVLQSLGRPEKPQPVQAPGNHQYLGLGPGTGAYWRQFPNFGRDQTLVYRVTFSHAGAGQLRLHVFRGGPEPCLQSLDFSLETNAPELERARGELGRLSA